MTNLHPLLYLSALGVYFHGVYVSITLGFPVAIGIMLYLWSRRGDQFYLSAAKKMSAVLAVNFALGAITGTLVEFGLVQVWPGTIFAIATFAFAPLALELIAFIMEIAFLILFLVTLGRVKPAFSIAVLALYAAFAYFSGVLITAVNTWMQAPWGTGPVAKALYPFLPEFGPLAVDVQKLVALKMAAVASGQPVSLVLQSPGISEKIGVVLNDPWVAFYSPYAVVSIFHNILAAIVIGLSLAVAGWAYRYWKTGREEYLRIVKPLAAALAVLFFVQAPIVAHFQGEVVAKYNPTKFALMEGAKETHVNPLVGLVAFGDPNKPIPGFDGFYAACDALGNATVGDLAKQLNIDLAQVAGLLKLQFAPGVAEVKLADVCKADVAKAEAYMPLIFAAYYSKVAFAIVGVAAALVLAFTLNRVPVLSSVASALAKVVGGDEKRRVFLLAALAFVGAAVASVLGWYVREVGRKPWTVYGLLYPSEVVTPVDYAASPGFLAFAFLVVLAVNIGGLLAMYIVATRGLKFWRR